MRAPPWVLGLSLLGCHSSPPQSAAPHSGDRVTMERTKCFGTCVPYIVTIEGDGGIAFDRKDSVAKHRTGTADPSRVRHLFVSVDSVGFFDLTNYPESAAVCRKAYMTDLPSATVTVAYRGRTHTVEHYLGCRAAPRAMWMLEAMIDSVGQSSRFLDGNFGGPYGSTFMHTP